MCGLLCRGLQHCLRRVRQQFILGDRSCLLLLALLGHLVVQRHRLLHAHSLALRAERRRPAVLHGWHGVLHVGGHSHMFSWATEVSSSSQGKPIDLTCTLVHGTGKCRGGMRICIHSISPLKRDFYSRSKYDFYSQSSQHSVVGHAHHGTGTGTVFVPAPPGVTVSRRSGAAPAFPKKGSPIKKGLSHRA